MSLKYDETNIRSGPNKKFPIKYKYKIKSIPVIVLGKYDNWYKIKDKDNNIGWVNNHLLSKSRSVITLNEKNFVYKDKKIEKSYPIMKIDKNIVLKLIACNKQLCKIRIKEKDGWIKKEDIWGWDNSLL